MLIYLFILSLEENYSKILYLLLTLCQNIRVKIKPLIESYYECNFSFCSFIFCEVEDTAFVARTVIIFLNRIHSVTVLLPVYLRNICYKGHHRKLQETKILNVF